MAVLPQGTVTFLFTDVEGSTRLRRGDVAAAAQRVAESLGLFRLAGTEGGVFEALLLAAVTIDRRGDSRTSVRLHSAARALASARAYELSAGELELADEALALTQASLGAEASADEWSRGEQMDLAAAVAAAVQSLD